MRIDYYPSGGEQFNEQCYSQLLYMIRNHNTQDFNQFQKSLDSALSQGFPVDHHSRNHRNTLFMCSLYAGAVDMARMLLENGADVNFKNNLNQIPLHYACITEYLPEDLFAIIAERTTNVNEIDNYGRTPLMYVAERYVLPYEHDRDPMRAQSSRLSRMKELVNVGADTSCLDNWDVLLPAMYEAKGKENKQKLMNYIGLYQEQAKQLNVNNSTVCYDYEL